MYLKYRTTNIDIQLKRNLSLLLNSPHFFLRMLPVSLLNQLTTCHER